MPKKREFPPEMHEACRQTVAAYERLIETGDGSAWRKYGNFCALCCVTGDSCYTCVLGPQEVQCIGGGEPQETFHGLMIAVSTRNNNLPSTDKRRIQGVARARLAWLLKRFKKAGIDLVGDNATS